jgi:hypothetical protein
LKAASPKQLERLMLKNNLQRKCWHRYQIIFDGKAWFAWFDVDLSGAYNQEINEIEGETSDPSSQFSR